MKNKNEELRKSEYKFRNIFNSSLDSISIINSEGDILEVNAITCFTTGYSRDKLLTSKFVEVFPTDQHEKINSRLRELYEDGEIFLRPII